MRAAAGLHADQAARQLGKKPHHLAPPQLATQDHLPARIDRMNLKNPLGQI
jgi:hypothetical protein